MGEGDGTLIRFLKPEFLFYVPFPQKRMCGLRQDQRSMKPGTSLSASRAAVQCGAFVLQLDFPIFTGHRAQP